MKRIISSPGFAINGFLLFTIALFFYAFTQIDLSLTFSQASVLQSIQKAFQYVGYFNRPLATELFFLIIVGLFTCYILLLDRIREKKIPAKKLWFLLGVVTLLLTFAYNAFSYDLFNYIFDAKIITQYQENPYMKKALDFPGDPMLSFMRWTHRVYPYGPVWLGLTVPLSYLGMQKFAITFFLFKFLMTGAYLGTVYYLYQILKKLTPENALFGTAFFALNPLVLIESLVSAHNDIVMMFFAVMAVYFLIKKRIFFALLLLFLSIGIKFATILMLPVFIYAIYQYVRKEKINWDKLFFSLFFFMIVGVFAVTIRTNFQPWYLLYILPFAALLSDRRYIFTSIILVTITALFNYVPYLFTGNWDEPIPTILLNLNLYSAATAMIIFLTFYHKNRRGTK